MSLKGLAASACTTALVLSMAPSALAQTATAMPSAKYTSCAKLNKVYPHGVAHPDARVSKGSKYVWDKRPDGKHKLRPSKIDATVFNNLYKSFDRDGDKIKCEVPR